MSAKVAVAFSFFAYGDGTTDPITVDLATDPIFLASPETVAKQFRGNKQP